MSLYLLIIGCVSILGQVIILRELSVAFYGVELIYILAMGIWLFGTGIGALIGRKAHIPSERGIRFLFLFFSLVLPLDIAFIRAIRLLFQGVTGTYLPFFQQLAGITIAMLPIGILLGLIFQWAARLYVDEDQTLAMAYAIESVGGLAGGLLSTLFCSSEFRISPSRSCAAWARCVPPLSGRTEAWNTRPAMQNTPGQWLFWLCRFSSFHL